MPFHELETLTARLIYASGILPIHLPRYYWAIKYTRRQISLNKAIIHDNTELILSHGVRRQLSEWLQRVLRNPWTKYEIDKRTTNKTATLYTDASLSGWGAVLFLPRGTIYATGAQRKTDTEINRGETQAVLNALHAFDDHWSNITHIKLRIDNTSAAAAIQRKWSNSSAMSSVLDTILNFTEARGLKIEPSYIRSEENIADSWSRKFQD